MTDERIQEFLVARTGRAWEPDEDLFDAGVGSSLFALELVVHLENAFGVAVGGEDLTQDNFRTVRAMSALVQRLRTADDGA